MLPISSGAPRVSVPTSNDSQLAEQAPTASRLDPTTLEGAMYGLYGDRFQAQPAAREIPLAALTGGASASPSHFGEQSVEGAMQALYGNRFQAQPAGSQPSLADLFNPSASSPLKQAVPSAQASGISAQGAGIDPTSVEGAMKALYGDRFQAQPAGGVPLSPLNM